MNAETKSQLENFKNNWVGSQGQAWGGIQLPQDSGVCPHCGRCRHCGQGAQPPYYPPQPIWVTPNPFAPAWPSVTTTSGLGGASSNLNGASSGVVGLQAWN